MSKIIVGKMCGYFGFYIFKHTTLWCFRNCLDMLYVCMGVYVLRYTKRIQNVRYSLLG